MTQSITDKEVGAILAKLDNLEKSFDKLDKHIIDLKKSINAENDKRDQFSIESRRVADKALSKATEAKEDVKEVSGTVYELRDWKIQTESKIDFAKWIPTGITGLIGLWLAIKGFFH